MNLYLFLASLPTDFFVSQNNTKEGLLPSIYYGTLSFFQNNLMPLIIIIFLIFSVLIILSIGIIIKKLFEKIG